MDPLNSLKTLLQGPTKSGLTESEGSSASFQSDCDGACLPKYEVCPSVFKLYTYLRSHPLVIRQLRLLAASKIGDPAALMHQIEVLDRRLYFRTAYHYNAIGCPALALEVLTRLPEMMSTIQGHYPKNASLPKSIAEL